MTFTKTPPTTPGIVAYRPSSNTAIRAGEIKFSEKRKCLILDCGDGFQWSIDSLDGGEWCRLVPAGQIVNAFTEGWLEAAKLPEHYDEAWKHSHAKQIAEGTL